METIKMTSSEFLKQIKLGFIIQVKCISVFIKQCELVDLKGNKTFVFIDIK